MVESFLNEEINACRNNNSITNGDCRFNVTCFESNNWAMIFGYNKQRDRGVGDRVISLDSPISVNILSVARLILSWKY